MEHWKLIEQSQYIYTLYNTLTFQIPAIMSNGSQGIKTNTELDNLIKKCNYKLENDNEPAKGRSKTELQDNVTGGLEG